MSEPSTTAGRSHQSGPDLFRALEIAAAILAPATGLTALLYFFAWVRTGAFYDQFGVSQRTLGYSVQDYLVRSPDVAFRPTAALVVLALVAFAVWAALARIRRWRRLWLVTLWVLSAGAAALCAIGISVLFGLSGVEPLWAAVGVVVGTILAEVVASAMTVTTAIILRRVIVGVALTVGSFWVFSILAHNDGTALARQWEADIPGHTASTTVYSMDDLHFDQSWGVVTTKVAGDDRGYVYRYTGLRLLVYSNDRWFLIPHDWSPTNGAPTIVLRDTDRLRVETIPHPA
jgi:hypothetical protein